MPWAPSKRSGNAVPQGHGTHASCTMHGTSEARQRQLPQRIKCPLSPTEPDKFFGNSLKDILTSIKTPFHFKISNSKQKPFGDMLEARDSLPGHACRTLCLGLVGFAWDHVTAFMGSVVLCVRECLSLLLDALVAPTANADSNLTANQPCCGWDDVIFIQP